MHGVPKYKAPHPKFSHTFWIGNYQNMEWREPETILKFGEWRRYISQQGVSNSIVSFGNETWSEDLIIFDSTRIRHKPLRPICDHYWVFLWWLLLLKYFISKNLVWRGMLIPNFGVSTTILSPIDIFCRWYKLNFGLLQGEVKLYHFYEWIEAKRHFLKIFVQIYWSNWLEATLNNHFGYWFGFIITF